MVVDGARPHHHDQTVIRAMQHLGDRSAAAFHQRQRGGGHRQPFLQQCRGDERADRTDTRVVDAGGVVGGEGGGVGVVGHGGIVAGWYEVG